MGIRLGAARTEPTVEGRSLPFEVARMSVSGEGPLRYHSPARYYREYEEMNQRATGEARDAWLEEAG